MKKAFLALFLVLTLMALSVVPSQATTYTCTVYSAGAEVVGRKTYYVAYLTDDGETFAQEKFFLENKEMLATMLTAVASGKKVLADIQGGSVLAVFVGKY